METKKHTKGVGFLIAAVPVVLTALAVMIFYWKIYRVEPVFSTATYELGERVSNDTEDYISGTEWSRGLAQLDLSEVDRKHAGVYEAVLYHGRDAFVYTIVIEDTPPPEIREKERTINVRI